MPKGLEELTQATSLDGNELLLVQQDTEDKNVVVSKFVLVSEGTTFPLTPTLGDECYRTDLDEWYKYNGAVWMQI